MEDLVSAAQNKGEGTVAYGVANLVILLAVSSSTNIYIEMIERYGQM